VRVAPRKRAATQQEFDAIVARYEVSKASVSEARSILSYARVTAPFAGVVTHKLADVGELASPGRPLIELEDPSDLRFEAAIPEALSGFVSVGSPLSVRVSDLPNDIEGVVAEISPAADPNSRTLLTKIALPAREGLRAGQFGRALVPTGRTDILRLPATAILNRGQLEIAFVVARGKASMRLVKTGRRFGEDVEVVAGLDADELVVVAPPRDLVDGQPVEVAP
ncbi:MAG: efflux RND transporter periplasmic adaptor subunit, partial [Myxococcales bacterium]|nr:efflux RND transporter periplasmic adaptor subunit [Myxococcales bacterium]